MVFRDHLKLFYGRNRGNGLDVFSRGVLLSDADFLAHPGGTFPFFTARKGSR